MPIPKGNRDYYWCGHNELRSLSGRHLLWSQNQRKTPNKIGTNPRSFKQSWNDSQQRKMHYGNEGHEILRLPHFRKWHKTRPRVDPEDIKHRSAEKQEAVGLIYGSGKLLWKIRRSLCRQGGTAQHSSQQIDDIQLGYKTARSIH